MITKYKNEVYNGESNLQEVKRELNTMIKGLAKIQNSIDIKYVEEVPAIDKTTIKNIINSKAPSSRKSLYLKYLEENKIDKIPKKYL